MAPSLGVSLLLLGTACSGANLPDGDPAPPADGEMRPSDAPSSAPTSPATTAAGETTTSNESLANGPAPALDGSGAPGPTPPPADPGAADPDEPADDAVPPSGEAGNAGDPGSGPPGGPPTSDPNVDENLVFIQQDGFRTTYFVSGCRSIGEDGSSIEGTAGGTLPVGGGRVLECRLENLPSRATTDVLSASDEPWCALGQLGAYEPGGDPRLSITIVTPPDVSPAILVATHDGETFDLTQAVFFGAAIWPLWIEAAYDVDQVAPAEQGKLCDEIFGI
jgi:hypothetical protein